MNRWIKTTATALLMAGFAATAGAQDTGKPNRPEKETKELKELRQKGEQLRIDRLRYAVKEGRVDKDRAAFMIKQIRHMSAFKNENPDWIKYGRLGKGMQGRQGKGGCPMMGQARRDGKRRGMRRGDGKGMGRGNRDGMHGKLADWRKNLTAETVEMKKLRHQARDLHIARIQFAVKQGFLAADQADYMLKKLRSMSAFKDQNPDWVKYGRGFRKGGQGRGMRDGKGSHKRMRGDK